MTSPTPPRQDRRAVGDAMAWLVLGVVLLGVGLVGGWPFVMIAAGLVSICAGATLLFTLRGLRRRTRTAVPGRAGDPPQ